MCRLRILRFADERYCLPAATLLKMEQEQQFSPSIWEIQQCFLAMLSKLRDLPVAAVI
jgi:hypothetical protein